MYSAGSAHDPRKTDEEDDTEDVLDTRQEDANERAHASRRRRFRHVRVSGRCCRNSVRVVRQGAEKSRRTRPVFDLVLKSKYTCK